MVLWQRLRNLGSADGYLGYGGGVRYRRSRALAIEFDTYHNVWDPKPSFSLDLRRRSGSGAAVPHVPEHDGSQDGRGMLLAVPLLQRLLPRAHGALRRQQVLRQSCERQSVLGEQVLQRYQYLHDEREECCLL
ncbi:hypothetical protein CLOM_g14581 [Closterium sp. NIES-68]|nr:hypothetical protein CLOM_g14581 [Closterium sp. NIES-68]